MTRADDHWWQYRLSPAGVPIRIVAFLVDWLLMLAVVGSYFWFIEGFRDTAGSYLDPDLRATLAPGEFWIGVTNIFGLSSLVGLVYSVGCEASPWMGTIGKRLVGIRVVDEFGERITLTTSIIRNLAKILSFAALGLGCLAAIWAPAGQGWHDRLARTFVAQG